MCGGIKHFVIFVIIFSLFKLLTQGLEFNIQQTLVQIAKEQYIDNNHGNQPNKVAYEFKYRVFVNHNQTFMDMQTAYLTRIMGQYGQVTNTTNAMRAVMCIQGDMTKQCSEFAERQEYRSIANENIVEFCVKTINVCAEAFQDLSKSTESSREYVRTNKKPVTSKNDQTAFAWAPYEKITKLEEYKQRLVDCSRSKSKYFVVFDY